MRVTRQEQRVTPSVIDVSPERHLVVGVDHADIQTRRLNDLHDLFLRGCLRPDLAVGAVVPVLSAAGVEAVVDRLLRHAQKGDQVILRPEERRKMRRERNAADGRLLRVDGFDRERPDRQGCDEGEGQDELDQDVDVVLHCCGSICCCCLFRSSQLREL